MSQVDFKKQQRRKWAQAKNRSPALGFLAVFLPPPHPACQSLFALVEILSTLRAESLRSFSQYIFIIFSSHGQRLNMLFSFQFRLFLFANSRVLKAKRSRPFQNLRFDDVNFVREKVVAF